MSDKPTEMKSGEDPDTEIRKIKVTHLIGLCNILNDYDCWKKLMSAIPSTVNVGMPRFTYEEIKLIETTAKQRGTGPAEIFLEEWGTMGKKRPTLKLLMDLLAQSNLYRAADYIAEEIIKCPLPERPPQGPAAYISIPDINSSMQKIAGTAPDEIVSDLFVELPSTSDIAARLVHFSEINLIDDSVKARLEKESEDALKVSSKLDTLNLIKFSSEKSISMDIISEPNLIRFSGDKAQSKGFSVSSFNSQLQTVQQNIKTSIKPDDNVLCASQQLLQAVPSNELPVFLSEGLSDFSENDENSKNSFELPNEKLSKDDAKSTCDKKFEEKNKEMQYYELSPMKSDELPAVLFEDLNSN